MAEPAAAYVATIPRAPRPRAEPILAVDDLRTWFFTRDGVVRAVDGVSFQVTPGETLAIVGESGCGKSVTALSLLRLIPSPPGRIVSGTIRFAGRNLLGLDQPRPLVELQNLAHSAAVFVGDVEPRIAIRGRDKGRGFYDL